MKPVRIWALGSFYIDGLVVASLHVRRKGMRVCTHAVLLSHRDSPPTCSFAFLET